MRLYLVAVLMASLTACGATDAKPSPPAAGSPSPTKVQINGSVTVDGSQNLITNDGTCIPTEGYIDIQPGAQLTLQDDAGRTLALADLSEGTTPGQEYDRCMYQFNFGSVDLGDGEFFSIEAGRRGKVRYTRAQLAAKPLELSLGGS